MLHKYSPFLYSPLIVLMAVCILAPIGEPTIDDPTGGAKYMAPLLALIAVTLNILRQLAETHGTEDKLLKLVVGIGLLFSAYFWLATLDDGHPYSKEALTGLGLLVGIMVALTIIPAVVILLIWATESTERSE